MPVLALTLAPNACAIPWFELWKDPAHEHRQKAGLTPAGPEFQSWLPSVVPVPVTFAAFTDGILTILV